jgi:hypothetical protein
MIAAFFGGISIPGEADVELNFIPRLKTITKKDTISLLQFVVIALTLHRCKKTASRAQFSL